MENYRDRAFSSEATDPDGDQIDVVNVAGVNEVHEGAEFDLNYRPVQGVLVGGTTTIGDYYYSSNAGPATLLNEAGQPVAGKSVSEVFLKGEKIGDIPQNMFSAFTDINLTPAIKVGARVVYYTDYTSYVPFTEYLTPDQHPYIVPNYAIWSMNAVYKFKMAGFDAELIGNVNNLLNSKVLTDVEDYTGKADLTQIEGYWLNARTFTTALKVRF
jgi:iron complex outermembrane receptor protein